MHASILVNRPNKRRICSTTKILAFFSRNFFAVFIIFGLPCWTGKFTEPWRPRSQDFTGDKHFIHMNLSIYVNVNRTSTPDSLYCWPSWWTLSSLIMSNSPHLTVTRRIGFFENDQRPREDNSVQNQTDTFGSNYDNQRATCSLMTGFSDKAWLSAIIPLRFVQICSRICNIYLNRILEDVIKNVM